MHKVVASVLPSICLCLCAGASFAGNARPLLTGSINETQTVTLEGNTPPAALDPVNDRGAVVDTMRLEHMLLVLKRSPEDEAGLQKLIEDMHDPAAAGYHNWLTPQQVGERFGLAREDLDVIQRWLESHGFTVNLVHVNGLVIDFSGSAAEVRETFHTEIHQLVMRDGVRHIANIRDPQVPAALASAIQGVASLHDFFPKSHAIQLGPVSYNRSTNMWTPHFNIHIQGAL